MKVNLQLISLSILALTIFISPAQAINPIIIKKADFGAPPADNKLSDDSNYYPNEASQICKVKYSISETFQPKDIGGSDRPVYQPYTVTEIKGLPPIVGQDVYSNGANKNHQQYLGNTLDGELNDPENVRSSFLNYTPKMNLGVLGSANKAIPDQVLRCLIGQRLVKAVRLARGDEGGIYSNEQIAWYENGKYIAVTNSTQDTGKKIQLDDIAIAINKNPYISLSQTDESGKPLTTTTPNYAFYDPEANCYDTTETAPLPAELNSFVVPESPSFTHIEPIDAIILYKSLSPIDNGPSRRKVRTCSQDVNGNEFDCEIKQSSIPRGAVFPSSISFFEMIKPESQEVPVVDICKTNENSPISDKPNEASFSIKAFTGFVEEIIDATKTISHDLVFEFKLDSKINEGISAGNVSLKNLIPQSGMESSCLSQTDQGYSTGKKTVDPGNDCARTEVSKWLMPDSDQIL